VYIAVPVVLLGDTIALKSGRKVEGTYLGGDARQVRVAVADKVESFPIADIASIHFGSAAPAASVASSAPAPVTPPARAEILRPERTAPSTPESTARTDEIPAGTLLVVRMIDDVDSERDRVGQTFKASIDEAVEVNGSVLVPRGADVLVKLVDDKQSGKFSGRTELTLDIVSISVGGKEVDVSTQEVTTASESRTGSTARNVGGGAALGAIIGAIAGGGRGAAIGATTGAAAGGAVQVLTKGQKVKIPSETRLQFTLQNAVRL
jgi:hypothetical protein